MCTPKAVSAALILPMFLIPNIVTGTGGISGTVTAAADGSPLPCEAEMIRSDGEWIASAFCDAAGDYLAEGLAAGTYKVFVEVPDQPDYVHQWYDDTVFWDRATIITVTDGQVAAGIDFQLRHGGRVSGHVLENASSEPIFDVWMAVYMLPDWDVAFFDQTDEEGAYDIRGIPPGTFQVEAYVDSDEYITQYWDHVDTEYEATGLVFEGTEHYDAIDFDLYRGGEIHGRVVSSPDGGAIAGAYVEAHDEDWVRSRDTLSAADGSFRLIGLPPFDYWIYADTEDYRGSYYVDSDGVPISITVADGEVVSDVVISLSQGGAISGRVVRSADNSPVAYGYVYAWRPADHVGDAGDTDEQGAFRIDGLPAGTYQLYAEGDQNENLQPQIFSDESGNPVLFQVVVGEEIGGVVVALEDGGTVAGTVVSALDAEPIADVYVYAEEIDGYAYRDGTTDADGRYVIRGLGDAELLVTALHPDYMQETYEDALFDSNGTPVQVDVGETTDGIDFTLTGAGTISGMVVSALTGEPITFAEVEAFFDEDTAIPGAFAETNALGEYTMGSVIAGQQVYVLAYDWQGRYAWQWFDSAFLFNEAVPLTVVEGETTPGVNFMLDRPGVVSVSVSSMRFTGQTYAEDIPTQTLVVTNDGPGPAGVDLWAEPEWLCVDFDWEANLLLAGDELPVVVSAWPWGLSPGTYEDQIHIYNYNTGQEILVDVELRLTESPPVFDLDPWDLYFDAEVDGDNPPSAPLYLANYGGGAVTFTASTSVQWMSVHPRSGTLSRGGDASELTVSTNITGLAVGDYAGQVILASSMGEVAVDAELYVSPAPEADPDIVAPETIVIRLSGDLPPEQAKVESETEFEIANEGEGTLYWTVREQDDWATVEPSSGTIEAGDDPAKVSVSVDPSGLSAGINSTYLEVASSRDQAAIELAVQIGSGIMENDPAKAAENGQLVVPVLVHADGVNDSRFVSDVWITHRPTGEEAVVTLHFVPEGADGTTRAISTTVTLGSGETLALLDVLQNWLDDRITKGSLVIVSGSIDDMESSSRTYNSGKSGTYGQEIPGVTSTEGLSRLDGRLYLPGLDRSTDPATGFRSNLLLTEVAGKAARARIELYDATGGLLGAGERDVKPFSTVQINRVFQALGYTGAVRGARAEVRVVDGDGRLTALGSKVDNVTSDPTTISGVRKNSGLSISIVPVVANAEGELGTKWVSDVVVSNVDSVMRTASIYYHDRKGQVSGPVKHEIAPGNTLLLDDVVGDTFGKNGARGSLRIEAEPTGGLVVTSRTYNQSENGTFGQGVPGVAASDALVAGGGVIRLIALSNTERYRTNIGITEMLGAPVTVGVTLRDQRGVEVLGYREVQIPAYGQFQSNLFDSMGLGETNVFAATAVVNVVGGSGGVTVYASMVDNRTGDGTTLPPPKRLRAGASTAPEGGPGGIRP